MDHHPLGDYQAFQWWSGRPRSWGPAGAGWRVWFGGKVVDGLCEVLDEHLAAARSHRAGAQPAAIGCVPWLTSQAVLDRLVRLGACCVVLDKGAALPVRLVEHDRPFPNVLPRLQMTTPADDGQTAVLGPSSSLPEHDLGPVRVLGWRRTGGWKPLLHAKLLVLGELGFATFSPDDAPEFEEWQFTPQSVWWGSANWTEAARDHLEAGFWSDDDELARQATSFVEDVILFSEPVGSTCAGPEPNLVTVEFDDEAMAEAAREQWLDHLADNVDVDGW